VGGLATAIVSSFWINSTSSTRIPINARVLAIVMLDTAVSVKVVTVEITKPPG